MKSQCQTLAFSRMNKPLRAGRVYALRLRCIETRSATASYFGSHYFCSQSRIAIAPVLLCSATPPQHNCWRTWFGSAAEKEPGTSPPAADSDTRRPKVCAVPVRGGHRPYPTQSLETLLC